MQKRLGNGFVRQTLLRAAHVAMRQGKPFPELSDFGVCAYLDYVLRDKVQGPINPFYEQALHRALVISATANAIRHQEKLTASLGLADLCKATEAWYRLLMPYVKAADRQAFTNSCTFLQFPLELAFPGSVFDQIFDCDSTGKMVNVHFFKKRTPS